MAAGLGFKTFNTGDVLSAADVNGYLMQGVLVFASAAARDAAITAPAEGQFAFTKDTNGLWYYDGAAWVASGATGDIEGVTAGTGISGGGTSGTVTITNSMATAIDAKGDLVVGTGADTFSRLAVGANDTVLTADSTAATGLKWAAAAGGGGMTLLSTTTLSGASTTISGIDQSYTNLFIVFSDVVNSAAFQLRMQVNSATTSCYGRVMQCPGSSGTVTTVSSALMDNAPRFLLTANTDNAANDVFEGTIDINLYSSTATMRKKINSFLTTFQNGYYTAQFGSSSFFDVVAINSLTFSPNTGTFSGGTLKIYGVK